MPKLKDCPKSSFSLLRSSRITSIGTFKISYLWRGSVAQYSARRDRRRSPLRVLSTFFVMSGVDLQSTEFE